MGSSSYTPRHRSSQRGRRGTAALRSAVRRPVVGGAIAVAMLGTVGATFASGYPSQVGDTTAAITAESSSSGSSDGRSAESAQADTARLAEDRRATNVSRSASREQDRRDEVQRKRAATKKRAEARRKAEARADRAERAREQKQREKESKPVSERDFTAAQLKEIRKDPKPYAIELMRERGWDDGEWGCLDSLWVGESDWEWNAKNPTSGAYGIPQSLPATKMASAGDDWKTNPITQIEWGLDYIKDTYGSPCEAKSFWDSKDPHWY